MFKSLIRDRSRPECLNQRMPETFSQIRSNFITCQYKYRYRSVKLSNICCRYLGVPAWEDENPTRETHRERQRHKPVPSSVTVSFQRKLWPRNYQRSNTRYLDETKRSEVSPVPCYTCHYSIGLSAILLVRKSKRVFQLISNLVGRWVRIVHGGE